ncbi:phytoene/squalene synthase family protein [Pantoea sp. A4]|uniref:phytoene/squalene synthase family protein n=1 Tax=Pantoea sp. A4 TaxID=1225184 RepID=UPI00035CB586|nr:phytoene/squalene synthase family protein [Pantoea sp. A4]
MSETLYDHAAVTMAAGSKSFSAAARLFDPATRRSVLMLYSWCRFCDDVIDDQWLGFTAPTPSQIGADQRLAQLHTLTREAWEGKTMQEPAFAALQEVVQRHNLSRQYALEHLEGFAMDVRETRYFTFEDTLRYCYHVAGVVGLMMAQIMGVTDAKVLGHARDLGIAFQLTNIARDVIEDASNGRCYLPDSWIAEAGLTRENYAEEAHRMVLAVLAKRLVTEAEPYYASAQQGLPALPWRSAWAIATASGVYRAIGIKVVQRSSHAWDQRISTSNAEKVGLLIKGLWVALQSRSHKSADHSERLLAKSSSLPPK